MQRKWNMPSAGLCIGGCLRKIVSVAACSLLAERVKAAVEACQRGLILCTCTPAQACHSRAALPSSASEALLAARIILAAQAPSLREPARAPCAAAYACTIRMPGMSPIRPWTMSTNEQLRAMMGAGNCWSLGFKPRADGLFCVKVSLAATVAAWITKKSGPRARFCTCAAMQLHNASQNC